MWICVFLAVATLAVYAQVYRHDFIDFDDGAYVLDNWRIANGLTANNIIWAFTTGYASNWHPLTWLSHMIDCQVFGLNPGPQHLVNLFLHVANTLLLFLVLRDLTRAEWKSAFVAALFALHPLHVESVAWIAERKDVLSTLFWLLTLWAYTRYVRNPGRNRYLLMLFLFGFGLMAKPMLVTLPFVLLLLDFWPLRRFALDLPVRKGSARPPAPSIINRFLVPVLPLLREKIPLFLLAAASSIITFVVQKAGGAVRTVEVISFDTRIANVLHSYVAYLMKTAWPHNLSIFYRLPFGGYPAWEVTAAAAFLLCVSVLALHFAGRFPYLAVGWFWYLGTLVPVIGLVQVGGQAMADRYTYVPLIGIFVVVVWGVPDLVAKWPGAKRSLAAAGMMMVLACSVTTWFQVRLWRNTSSLFAHALEIDGDNYQAHGIAGTDLALHGKYEEAIRHYLEVLRLQPADTEIMCNLGYAFYRLGKKDQALELYQRALKIKPDYPIALRNMGQALYDQGKFEEAVVLLRRAEPKMPENLVLCSSLGNALAKLGKNQEAIDVYNRVLAMQPAYVEAQFGLGVALAQQGNTPDAVRSFEKALQIKPDYPEIYDTLGNISLSQGRIDEALSHYAEALRLKPDYAEAHYNMGVALYSQGKKAEAIVHYREAIRLKPDYADAFYNLAVALGSQGDFQGAVANYIEAIRVKPDFADAYNNLGTLLFNQGQVQKALDAFTEALRVRPDYAEARRNRDLILSSLGRSKRIP
ncbi:MAG: tetratricopeptide repeat protein [Acidobacteriia bacterium]|nr:tetratricopeptide repeat protein [Terriglobia bacterium]